MKRLSRDQITSLILATRKAFDHLAQRARAAGLGFDTSKEAFDSWRHQQVMAAVGKPGLRACGNDDYRPCLAQFLSVMGRDDIALESHLKAQSDKERQLRFIVQRILDDAQLPEEYAQQIALDRWGCLIDDMDKVKLEQLVMTLRARVRSKRRKTLEAAA